MPAFDYMNSSGIRKKQLVYVCGLGVTGALGLPQYYHPELTHPDEYSAKAAMSSTFRRLVAFTTADKIVDIACGHGFTIVAARVSSTSHTALGFGLNSYSQIGYQAARQGYPLEIVSTPLPIFLPTASPISRVSCGRSHSLLMNTKGQIFSLGNNSFGQCGRPINEKEEYFGKKKVHLIPDLPRNICQIECGQDHSMFLTDDGKLYSCGWGADGQTGLGHFNNQPSPALVKGDIEGVKIVKVSSYAETVLALDTDGNVYGWGNTEYAQFRTLTNKETKQFNTPVNLNLKNIPGKIIDIAAGGTICAILNDRGQVFVWGFGLLGKGPQVDHSSVPTLIPETLFGMNVHNPDVKVTSIRAGLSRFAAISNSGDLYMWGKNRGSALGFAHARNQLFPMRVNMNQALVRKISLGIDHSCALVEKVC